MKLFTKYNRLNLAVTITIFVIGSFVFYVLLHYIFIHQIDETLDNEKLEVLSASNKYGKLPEIINTDDQYTEYINTPSPVASIFRNGYVRYSDSQEWSRQISFGVSIQGKNYTVVVSKPLEESEDLLQVVIMITIAMIAFILLAGYLINRAVLTRLWQPFYQTMGFIKKFNVEEKIQGAFVKTDIDEFDLLNENIAEMTSRIQADFQGLREFTGYAAHEMQTPLAIIRAKLEMFVQNDAFLQDNAAHVMEIERAVRKLSRLYQSLLLLTKIESGQFAVNDMVKLDEIIELRVDEVADPISSKHLDVEFIKYEPVAVYFHPYLADIVIGNLLNNAVRYNKKNGWIGISLQQEYLSISNTSDLEQIKQENLFKRFFRDPHIKEDGNGLGLAIVKRICDAAGYKLEYSYAEGIHTFLIRF